MPPLIGDTGARVNRRQDGLSMFPGIGTNPGWRPLGPGAAALDLPPEIEALVVHRGRATSPGRLCSALLGGTGSPDRPGERGEHAGSSQGFLRRSGSRLELATT